MVDEVDDVPESIGVEIGTDDVLVEQVQDLELGTREDLLEQLGTLDQDQFVDTEVGSVGATDVQVLVVAVEAVLADLLQPVLLTSGSSDVAISVG